MPAAPHIEENVRIAVVDDDASLLTVLTRVLRTEGYDVAGFDRAPPCVEAVKGGSVDVILTDIHMPSMTGVELLRAVKAHDPGVEVVMMTADAELDTAIEATRLGAFDYLRKPFDDIGSVVNVASRAVEHFRMRRRERVALESRRAQDEQGFLFTGRLEDVSLDQVLQVISNMERDGVIHITSADAPTGVIYLQRSTVTGATFGEYRAEKAFYRMIRTATGTYDVRPYTAPPQSAGKMGNSVASYVLEGVRRKDEFLALAAALPPLDGPWEMATSCEVPLGQLAPWLIELLADIIRSGAARAALESARYYDLDILKGLHYLWSLGAIRPRA